MTYTRRFESSTKESAVRTSRRVVPCHYNNIIILRSQADLTAPIASMLHLLLLLPKTIRIYRRLVRVSVKEKWTPYKYGIRS